MPVSQVNLLHRNGNQKLLPANLRAFIQWWHSSLPYIRMVKSIYNLFRDNLAADTLTGFPYPENVALAQDVEGQIRKYGAVPATICVLDGVCKVGLDSKELVQMAEASGKKNTLKVSRRDIPYLTGMVRAHSEVQSFTRQKYGIFS